MSLHQKITSRFHKYHIDTIEPILNDAVWFAPNGYFLLVDPCVWVQGLLRSRNE